MAAAAAARRLGNSLGRRFPSVVTLAYRWRTNLKRLVFAEHLLSSSFKVRTTRRVEKTWQRISFYSGYLQGAISTNPYRMANVGALSQNLCSRALQRLPDRRSLRTVYRLAAVATVVAWWEELGLQIEPRG